MVGVFLCVFRGDMGIFPMAAENIFFSGLRRKRAVRQVFVEGGQFVVIGGLL